MQDLIDYITNLWFSFWSTLKSLITEAYNWIYDLVSTVVNFFVDLLRDSALWVWDGMLSVVDFIMTLIVIPEALQTFTLQGLFDGVGGELIGLFGYIGVPMAITMISAAFMVRLVRDIVRR